MRTVTAVEFVRMLEANELTWPPFEAGGYIYSHTSSAKGWDELVRTATP